MADVKICDRCGKIIATATAQKLGFRHLRYNIVDRKERYRTEFDCDLCVDCGEKLRKFLNGWDPDERPDDALIYAR